MTSYALPIPAATGSLRVILDRQSFPILSQQGKAGAPVRQEEIFDAARPDRIASRVVVAMRRL